jgi:hypothetical protein
VPNRGLLRRLVSDLGRPAGSVNAILVAAGVFLTAVGVRHWVFVAWANDIGSAQSPVEFGEVLSFSDVPGISEGELGQKWRVVAVDANPEKACARLSRTLSDRSRSLQIVVIKSPKDPVQECKSMKAQGQGTLRMTSLAMGVVPASMTGFVLLDSLGRVVYGSRRLDDASRIDSILELLDASSSVPGK